MKQSKSAVIIFTLGVMLSFCLLTTASAFTYFSNLGPGQSYWKNGGWAIDGLTAPIQPQSIASEFTPVAGGPVSQIDLAVFWYSTPNERFHASIWTNVGGLPGVMLPGAFWDNLVPLAEIGSSSTGNLVTIGGITGVSLNAGVSYFMIVGATDVTFVGSWNFTDQLQTGYLASSPDGEATWPYTFTDYAPAYDILGSKSALVPEPSTFLLLGAGLGGLALLRRKARN